MFYIEKVTETSETNYKTYYIPENTIVNYLFYGF